MYDPQLQLRLRWDQLHVDVLLSALHVKSPVPNPGNPLAVILVIALCAGAVLAPCAHADPQRAGQSAVIDVTLVEVPVNVFDAAGNAVAGLGPEDFELFDNGRRQAITHFDVVDFRDPELAPADVPPLARRHFVLLFDLSFSSPMMLGRAQQAALKFAEDVLTDFDLCAVAAFSVEDGVELISGFSADREHLSRAIRAVPFAKSIRELTDPLRLVFTEADRTFARLDPEVLNLWLQSDEARERRRIERQLQSLGELARVLDSVNGRKQVVLLSEGFKAHLVSGRRFTPMREREYVTSGEIWRVDTDRIYGSVGTGGAVEAMANLFRRSGTLLHAIDLGGVRPAATAQDPDLFGSSDSLHLIAGGTGGEVFENTNDLGSSFRRMLEQQSVTYMLGFRPSGGGKRGSFRKLQVKVRRPSRARVLHRMGYEEKGVSGTLDNLRTALVTGGIISQAVPTDTLPAAVDVLSLRTAGDRLLVPVTVHVEGKHLTAHGKAMPLEIAIYAFDAGGRVAGFRYHSLTFDDLGRKLEETSLRYLTTLALPEGTYELRTLVRLPLSGRARLVRRTVEVRAEHTGTVCPEASGSAIVVAVDDEARALLSRCDRP